MVPMQQLEYAAAVAVLIVIPSTAPVSQQSGRLYRCSVSATLSELYIWDALGAHCGVVPACSPSPECWGLFGAARGSFSLDLVCYARDMTWPVVSLRHCKDARILCTIAHLAVSVHVRGGQALPTCVCGVLVGQLNQHAAGIITALQRCQMPASSHTDSMQEPGSDAGALHGSPWVSSCTVACLSSCTCSGREPDSAMQACVVEQQDHCVPPTLCSWCYDDVFRCINLAGKCPINIALAWPMLHWPSAIAWAALHSHSSCHSICCSSMPLQLAQLSTWHFATLLCNVLYCNVVRQLHCLHARDSTVVFD